MLALAVPKMAVRPVLEQFLNSLVVTDLDNTENKKFCRQIERRKMGLANDERVCRMSNQTG